MLNTTDYMEKAMGQHHQMHYQEYTDKLSNQLKVEKRREKEFQMTKHMYMEIEKQI